MATALSRHLPGPAASRECVFADGRGNATTVIARPRPGGAVASAAATHAFRHTRPPLPLDALSPSHNPRQLCMPASLPTDPSASIHFSAPPCRPSSCPCVASATIAAFPPLTLFVASTAGPGQLTLKSDRLQKDPVCGPQRGRRRICLGGNLCRPFQVPRKTCFSSYGISSWPRSDDGEEHERDPVDRRRSSNIAHGKCQCAQLDQSISPIRTARSLNGSRPGSHWPRTVGPFIDQSHQSNHSVVVLVDPLFETNVRHRAQVLRTRSASPGELPLSPCVAEPPVRHPWCRAWGPEGPHARRVMESP